MVFPRLRKPIMCLLLGLQKLDGLIIKLLHEQVPSVDGVKSGYLDHIILEATWFILFYVFCDSKCTLHAGQLSSYAEFLKR